MTKPLTREEKILRQFPAPGQTINLKPFKSRRLKNPPPESYATPRKLNTAMPQGSTGWKDTHYVPQRQSPLRPGSEDALACPSRTDNSYFYPLTGLRTQERI